MIRPILREESNVKFCSFTQVKLAGPFEYVTVGEGEDKNIHMVKMTVNAETNIEKSFCSSSLNTALNTDFSSNFQTRVI